MLNHAKIKASTLRIIYAQAGIVREEFVNAYIIHKERDLR